VLAGVVVLLFAIVRAPRLSRDGVAVVGLYWHFVDLVWMIVFASLYLR
jgi:heme/copper-type cytochrome/quinol oxidase subunit 3